MDNFFVSCPIGWEKDLAEELLDFWPFLIGEDGRTHSTPLNILEFDSGGLLIQAPFVLAVQINFFSKLAHRVLLRVAQFPAKSFPELDKKLSKINLAEYIGQQKISIKADCAQSMLGQEKRVVEVAEKAWKKYYDEKSEQTASIRIFKNLVTVSLDTSGEHLHFRSKDKHVGEAPLRETLAAWMLRQMLSNHAAYETQGLQWLDPMAGSGTLISEAYHLHKPVRSRAFSFQSWAKTPKLFKTTQFALNYVLPPTQGWSFLASDLDDKLLHKNLPKDVVIKQGDVLKLKLESHPKRWVVTNPPYGERISLGFELARLIDAIVSFGPEKMGFLLSQQQLKELPKQVKGYSLDKKLNTKNGGLPVVFCVFTRQTATL